VPGPGSSGSGPSERTAEDLDLDEAAEALDGGGEGLQAPLSSDELHDADRKALQIETERLAGTTGAGGASPCFLQCLVGADLSELVVPGKVEELFNVHRVVRLGDFVEGSMAWLGAECSVLLENGAEALLPRERGGRLHQSVLDRETRGAWVGGWRGGTWFLAREAIDRSVEQCSASLAAVRTLVGLLLKFCCIFISIWRSWS